MMRKMGGWKLWLSSGFAGMTLAMAAVFGVGFEGGAKALTNCTVSDMSVDSEEQAFLGLINNYRAQNGLGALTMSTNLNRAATWHAADMGAKRYFSHTDSLGRSPSTRAQNCDYPAGAGENIAAGTAWSSAQSVFTAWRNSSGHNANMLRSQYTKIGIARVYTSGSPYGWYWVTDFGSVNDGTSGGGGTQPTATPTRTSTATPMRTPTQAAATPTRTPTQQPTSGSPAAISSPSNGSTLSGASVTFSWSAVTGAQEYFLYAGASQGSNSIVGRSVGTGTSTTVSNLPTNGSTVHVRLWTRFAAGWQYRDYTYTAANSGGGTQQAKAVMTSPSPGSQLAGTSATFQWSAGSGASAYFLYIGTSAGSNNLLGTQVAGQAITVNGLPRGGQTLYVRLWTYFGSAGWQYNDYAYRAAP